MTKRARKIIIAVMLLFLTVGVTMFFKYTKREEANKNKDIIDIKITEFNIPNRVVLNTETGIYIGNNLKELENGFFDIKILNKNNYVEVYLNKLWYETYGNDYIQDEYLARICRKLSEELNKKVQEADLENILYKYIKDNYLNVRSGETVECVLTKKYVFELDFKEDAVRLSIRGNE